MREDVFVIAEAGVNHNGSLDKALKLVQAAADAGANAVKFQTFQAESLVTATVRRAQYQSRALGCDGSQESMLKSLELPIEAYSVLSDRASQVGIEFMSTAFDELSIDQLVRTTEIRRIKIPSGELTNIPFLIHCAQKHLPMLVSTGMATIAEVQLAMDAIAFGMLHEGQPRALEDVREASRSLSGREAVMNGVVLLQCTTEYPTPPENVNLRAISTLRSEFGVRVGFSDHSEGIQMPIAAVAMGAVVIEKHLTLNRGLRGPDHSTSLEPPEFAHLVRCVRSVSTALGNGLKEPTIAERENRLLVRKVLVASRPISRGQIVRPEDVTAKRAGSGLDPSLFWEVVGKPAARSYEVDDQLEAPTL